MGLTVNMRLITMCAKQPDVMVLKIHMTSHFVILNNQLVKNIIL